MKRLVIVLLILCALAAATAYIFIPGKINISAVSETSANPNAVYRYLLQDRNWMKWWPGPTVYHYDDMHFLPSKKLLNSFEMLLVYKRDTLINILKLIPLSKDSTALSWSCYMENSKNPIKRWIQYFDAMQMKKGLDVLTDSLKKHLGKEENIYGFSVQKVKVTDSVLISTKSSFDHYPNEQEIDVMVQKLKNYIKKEKAIEKNYPMLNVHQTGPAEFEAMVAIATERLLPATKDFAPKMVLKGGNILEAEFKGGPASIKQAFHEFENYKTEMQFVAPAIPYQLMITDRAKEKDTSRWITRFYYPVF